MPDQVLVVRGLSARYGQALALFDVGFSVDEGRVVALLGVNGAGKTTTLKVVSGVHPATSGTIEFQGEDITGCGAQSAIRKGIAHSPEGRRVFPYMSVRENLEVGGFSRSRREVADGIDRAFEMFPILRDREAQLAGTMSGGEQQMLAIARALMTSPKLLLLDEPTLGLSPKMVGVVASIVRSIKDRGVSILLVEQNAKMALDVADEAYVIEGGRVTMHGSASEMRNDGYIQAVYFGHKAPTAAGEAEPREGMK